MIEFDVTTIHLDLTTDPAPKLNGEWDTLEDFYSVCIKDGTERVFLAMEPKMMRRMIRLLANALEEKEK
jgi:hypothetical protein